MLNFLEYLKEKDQLLESFEIPYEYKWQILNNEKGIGMFTTRKDEDISFTIGFTNMHEERFPKKRTYYVEFEKMNTNWLDTYELTNSHDALRIISTVISMIKDYINRYEEFIDVIYFSSELTNGKRSKRTRFYLHLVQKMLPPNWEIQIFKDDYEFPSDEEVFLIKK